MKLLLICAFLVGSIAAEASKETSEKLVGAVATYLLPTEVLELYKAAKDIDHEKLEKLGEGLDCATYNSDEVVERAKKISSDLSEKIKAVHSYYKKKYDALGADAKKFIDELKVDGCTVSEEKDKDKKKELLKVYFQTAFMKYITLDADAQKDLEAQFPLLTLAKSIMLPGNEEQLKKTLYTFFPAEIVDWAIATKTIDHVKLRKAVVGFNFCTASEDEIVELMKKGTSDDFALKTKNIIGYFMKKYNAFGADAKKFVDELKKRVCDIFSKENLSERKQAYEELMKSTLDKYLALPTATQEDIEKQFPILAVGRAFYAYIKESSANRKFSPKFRMF